jgi:hypothetical protein
LRIAEDKIVPIAPGLGGCLATDRIVVDGRPVGYMYRQKPLNAEDSGWQFFAGDEDEPYLAQIEHHDVYDVNTIINYDPSILPFLDAAIGSAYERDSDGLFMQLSHAG